MNDIEKRTDFLLPKRSFWTGFSSIFNIFGAPNKFNSSRSGKEADKKAIWNDWEMIGQDFKKAFSEITYE
jgi:hypothetical protein